MRLKWNGSFEVYRIFARGVRLRGRLVHGRVSWGQIDKLLPPPSNKPFALPDFVLDIADSTISLATPFGPVGFALEGNGKLSGGFKGHAAVVSPRLVPGRCAATNLRANVAVAVVARQPQDRGAGDARPLHLSRPAASTSPRRASMPRRASTKRSPASTAAGGWRSAPWSPAPTASPTSPATSPTMARSTTFDGRVKLSAQKSRMATIYADRTRLDGGYQLGMRDGTFDMVGDYAADSAALDPSHARRRDPAARRRGQDPDRPGRHQHRQCDQPHRAQLQLGRAHQGRQLPRRRRGADHRRQHRRAERRPRAGLRRQRRDLLLAVGRAADRRQYRDGRRRTSAAAESAFASRAPERR